MIIIPEYNRKEKMKYCQGPLCHTYDTQDRKRGPKGNKVNQTRRRTTMYYGDNFCSMNCMNDWLNKYIDRAIDTVSGRITQPIILTENNAWRKRYRWGYGDNEDRHYIYNMVTGEERNITEQQYDDDNYTLNSV